MCWTSTSTAPGASAPASPPPSSCAGPSARRATRFRTGGGGSPGSWSSHDIDPTDLRDVLWGFATRSHPTTGIHVLPDTAIMHLMVCYTDEERETGRGPTVLFDCLREDELNIASFAENYPRSVQQRTRQLLAAARPLGDAP